MNDNDLVQLLLQQAKINAKLHDVKDDTEYLVNAINKADRQDLDEQHRRTAMGNAVKSDIQDIQTTLGNLRTELGQFKQLLKKVIAIGTAVIFGTSCLESQTVLTFLNRFM